jgi:hypothetical protein
MMLVDLECNLELLLLLSPENDPADGCGRTVGIQMYRSSIIGRAMLDAPARALQLLSEITNLLSAGSAGAKWQHAVPDACALQSVRADIQQAGKPITTRSLPESLLSPA